MFDEKAVASAPILFYNPWGGDAGSPVGDPDALSAKGGAVDTLIGRALSQGWVVVEPGMRGHNCTTGTPDSEGFHNDGKLPNPIADLKAALRYLRYETNASNIPGNKDHIFAAGTSSGGCATVMLGSSGKRVWDDLKLLLNGLVQNLDLAVHCPHGSNRDSHSLVHRIIYCFGQAVGTSGRCLQAFAVASGSANRPWPALEINEVSSSRLAVSEFIYSFKVFHEGKSGGTGVCYVLILGHVSASDKM